MADRLTGPEDRPAESKPGEGNQLTVNTNCDELHPEATSPSSHFKQVWYTAVQSYSKS